MISDNAKDIDKVMKNVGAQIYLDGLAGEDLSKFNSQLFKRRRERETLSVTQTPDGRHSANTIHSESVAFLEDNAAFRLPGGVHPALVYVRNSVAPFVVDRLENATSALVPRYNNQRQLNTRKEGFTS
jgi:hypothetical protein